MGHVAFNHRLHRPPGCNNIYALRVHARLRNNVEFKRNVRIQPRRRRRRRRRVVVLCLTAFIPVRFSLPVSTLYTRIRSHTTRSRLITRTKYV